MNPKLDEWSINYSLYEYICKTLPAGSVILELGSGRSSKAFRDAKYTVYSIEDNPKFVGRYNRVHYIYAPLVIYNDAEFPENKYWYDQNCIKLPNKYDLILVDGPYHAEGGRSGIVTFSDLFKLDVPIVFDDIHRAKEFKVMLYLSKKLNRPISQIYTLDKNKYWGVI